MATLPSPSSIQTPIQTFLDKKQPLMPRQSTSEVLSFTHIIADRLAPGQSVWDFFSPPEEPQTVILSQPKVGNTKASATAGLPPICPTSSSPRSSTSMGVITPTSPIASSFSHPNSDNNKPVLDERPQEINNPCEADASMSLSTITPTSSLPLSQSIPSTTPTTAGTTTSTATTTTSEAVVTSTTTTEDMQKIQKMQKRRSFTQSLKDSMISLTQLLSPTSPFSRASSPTTSVAPSGPPHYNILVLGSDSAPLASTIYKMSSLLPGSTKIRHYQEISGFFMAYFRSNDSFSCSPKVSTDEQNPFFPRGKDVDDVKTPRESEEVTVAREVVGGVKSRRSSIQSEGEEGAWAIGRSSEDTLLQLSSSFSQSTLDENDNSDNSTINSVKDMDCEEVLLSDTEADISRDMDLKSQEKPQTEEPSPSAKASLSVHAFSLDTTWPVPRTLAQTFWFPFAHGIVYVVDATRKNDPRGADHLLNARQFLASLVSDPHFKRKDIPVVVFANKAGTDPETCYRVDEIAEILGCEDWDINVIGGGGGKGARPWCVKSTRGDGAGDGIRESIEWLKSRMGEIWNP
ncbi:hypothetical protein BGZ46_003070 [Entomortierella lignicola]|nr:hypothetical protein BGZ46_003070 [Entomortierella lignicola]